MTRFVPDTALDYDDQMTRFPSGEALRLDPAYRRAHLPLVAPEHPDIIAEAPEQGYRMGRHETSWSLVLPVPWNALAASPGFRTIDQGLRDGPLAPKICWTSFDARKAVLHATLCSTLATGDPYPANPAWRDALAGMAPFAVDLRGLFSGSINRGRLYLKVYPEMRNGENCIHAVQRAFGRRQTALYVAGIYNLTDHLDTKETAWLAAFLAQHRDTPLATLTVETLWMQGVRDDLALDSEVAEIIRLG